MFDSNIPHANGHDRAADRAAINRANVQKSTGPRTDAGKQRSSLNALRHGLTGHAIVLPSEDQSAYQRHSQSFRDEYQPKGATETQLVQSITDISWQLNRTAAVETNLFSLGITEMEHNIRAIHPRRRGRPRHGPGLPGAQPCFRQPGHLPSAARPRVRADSRSASPDPGRAPPKRRAPARRRRHDIENAPGRESCYQPSDDGFVFSKAEIEAYINREERWQQARTTTPVRIPRN
jgi:hypothetical protein